MPLSISQWFGEDMPKLVEDSSGNWSAEDDFYRVLFDGEWHLEPKFANPYDTEFLKKVEQEFLKSIRDLSPQDSFELYGANSFDELISSNDYQNLSEYKAIITAILEVNGTNRWLSYIGYNDSYDPPENAAKDNKIKANVYLIDVKLISMKSSPHSSHDENAIVYLIGHPSSDQIIPWHIGFEKNGDLTSLPCFYNVIDFSYEPSYKNLSELLRQIIETSFLVHAEPDWDPENQLLAAWRLHPDRDNIHNKIKNSYLATLTLNPELVDWYKNQNALVDLSNFVKEQNLGYGLLSSFVHLDIPTAPDYPVDENVQHVIYDDGPKNNWRIKENNVTVNDVYADIVYSGDSSIRITYGDASYSTINFTHSLLDIDSYYWLEFYIFVGEDTNRNIYLVMKNDFDEEDKFIYIENSRYLIGGEYLKNQWQRVLVPLIDYPTIQNGIREIKISKYATGKDDELIIDQIRLVGAISDE